VSVLSCHSFLPARPPACRLVSILLIIIDQKWGKNFVFAVVFRQALGPTQDRINWTEGTLSPGVKWPGREAEHLHPACAEVKNDWSYTSTTHTSLWRGIQLRSGCVFIAWYLVKPRFNFTFTLYRTITGSCCLLNSSIVSDAKMIMIWEENGNESSAAYFKILF
jgi:hypothetical protein